MTVIIEELKKMKAELESVDNDENKENDSENETEESHEEEKEEAEKPEEVKEEEEIKEEKKEVKLDDAGYARLRREAAAEKRRADQAIKELEELRKAKESKEPQQETPLPPQLQSIVERDRFAQAEREFSIYENKAKQIHPEYGAVAAEYANAMYQSFKVQNPRKTDVELSEMTKRAILIKAAQYASEGYENPVEEMYHEARELGFNGKSLQKAEPKEEKLVPDMAKVAENRKRSTGMGATHGRSEGQMTLATAAELTSAEWAKLPKTEKQRLLYGR